MKSLVLDTARPRFSIKPEHVLVAGMCIVPAFLFQQSLLIKWFQVAFFILLSVMAGKRFRLLPNLIMVAGVLCAYLLTPNGRVLFTLLHLPVTTGALINGLERSATLIGMIYLSRFSVRKGLRLPGKTGNLLSLVFFYFERILEGERITRGNLIKKLDEKIFAVHSSAEAALYAKGGSVSENPSPISSSEAPVSTAAGLIFMVAVVSLNWVLLL